MKISKTTLGLLKNFSTINQSIVIKPGSTLATISNVKDIIASATVEETFENEFAIYDLNEFLSVVSLFEDPDFEFGSESVVISEGSSKQTYYYADPSIIATPPENGVNVPSTEVTGSVTKETLSKVIRAASINNASDVTFTNGDVVVHDKNVPTSNSFRVAGVVSHEGSEDYELSVSVENLKVIPDDYGVEICARGLSHFKGNFAEYYIALQPDGKYNA